MAKSKKKASRVYRPYSFFENKTKVKMLTANVRKSTLPKTKNFSKIVGLKTLQVICPKLGLKVLPFHIVKLSQPLNLKAIGLGTKYRRVLVRSDPKSEISKIEWNDCPRAIFSLKGKSVKALERDIRQWINGVRAERRRLHKKPASFIIHPLRPKSSYELVGRVFLSPSTIGGLGVNFGKPKETAIASSFRDSAESTREFF